MCVAAFGVTFGWSFYITWQPRYLKEVFGLDAKASKFLTGLPFLCGAVGCLVGGNLSDRLVRRSGSRRWGRAALGLVGFAGAGVCVLLTGLTTAAWQAVTLLCLAFLINDLAIPAIWAVSADVGGRFVGTVAGVMNMIGAFGTVACAPLVPVVLDALGDMPVADRWRVIFLGLAGSWFVAAAAWLFIDAGTPLFEEEGGAGG
jgi:MFS family permease